MKEHNDKQKKLEMAQEDRIKEKEKIEKRRISGIKNKQIATIEE